MGSTILLTVRQAREKQDLQTLPEDPPPLLDEVRQQLGWDLITPLRRPDVKET